MRKISKKKKIQGVSFVDSLVLGETRKIRFYFSVMKGQRSERRFTRIILMGVNFPLSTALV